MNKIIVLCTLVLSVSVINARPAPLPPSHGPGLRIHHAPLPPPRHHHDFWGKGGRNFWPGFLGGIIGSAIVSSPTPVVTTPVVVTPTVTAPVVATPVVTAPVVVAQPVQVWVEGHYVNQVQANGTIHRVWIPGHYEYK